MAVWQQERARKKVIKMEGKNKHMEEILFSQNIRKSLGKVEPKSSLHFYEKKVFHLKEKEMLYNPVL